MKTSEAATGVSFLQLLTVLFIGLKLGNVINWSWWWVLAPLWIPVGIALVVLMVALFVILCISDE